MVPDGMTSQVHSFDAREGGTFRISLTYDEPTGAGKTSAQTDTFHGRFVRLVPDTEVVQVVEFETDDPTMQGEMTITYTLADAERRHRPSPGVHENLPPGVSPADNELGWSMSIDKLAALVEPRLAETDPLLAASSVMVASLRSSVDPHFTRSPVVRVRVVGSGRGRGVVRGLRRCRRRVAGEAPAAFVAEGVVAATQQAEVLYVGGAAVFPPDEVVGVAPGGRPVTAGEDTAAVADRQRLVLRGGREAGGAAEVEDFGLAAHQHPGDGAVARQAGTRSPAGWGRSLRARSAPDADPPAAHRSGCRGPWSRSG